MCCKTRAFAAPFAVLVLSVPTPASVMVATRSLSHQSTTVILRGLPKTKQVEEFKDILIVLGIPSPSRTGIELGQLCNRAVMEFTSASDAKNARDKLLVAQPPLIDASWFSEDWQVETSKYERVGQSRSWCYDEEFEDVGDSWVGLEDFVEVHLNAEVVNQLGGDYPTFQIFSSKFVEWRTVDAPDKSVRGFERTRVLDDIRKLDDAFQVIGFLEFPYVDSLADSMAKRTQKQIQREYWLLLNRAGEDSTFNCHLAVLQVVYGGEWVANSELRDRSHIVKLLFRLSAGKSEQALESKVMDADRWRGMSQAENSIFVPNRQMWKWKDQPEELAGIYKILVQGEKCKITPRSTPAVSGSRGTSGIPDGGAGKRRRALILAVKKYSAEMLSNLPNAIHDGFVLECTLQRLGWDVDFETNVSLKSAEEAINQFAEKVGDNAEASLFAFVGHGIEINGKNYLVPSDADLEPSAAATLHDAEHIVRRSCLSFQHVVQHCFARTRNGTCASIFVLDCCRQKFFNVADSEPRGRVGCDLSPVSADIRNSCVIFSTTPGKTASDGAPGMGGPFMTAFTKEMIRPGIDLETVLRNVRRGMTALRNECQLAPSSSLLEDSFVFCPLGMKAAEDEVEQDTGEEATAAAAQQKTNGLHQAETGDGGLQDTFQPEMVAQHEQPAGVKILKLEGVAQFLSSGLLWSTWVNGKLTLLNNLVLRFESANQTFSDFIGCFHVERSDRKGCHCIELTCNQRYDRNCTIKGPRKLESRVYAFNTKAEQDEWYDQLRSCHSILVEMAHDLEEQTKAIGLTHLPPSASLSIRAGMVEGFNCECDFLGPTHVMHRASSDSAMHICGPTVLRFSQPFSKEQPYVEVFVCDMGGHFKSPPADVAVGFLNHDSVGVLFQAPGGAGNSLGYSGLDGSIVHHGRRSKGWGPVWQPGDRIGFGVWFDEHTGCVSAVYFTVNGKVINTGFTSSLSIGRGETVYPVVKLHRPWARIDLSPGFAQHPGSLTRNGLMISSSSPGI